MKMEMYAEFTMNKIESGKVVPIHPHKDTSVSVGGFEFVVDGKTVPFDFDASGCCENNGVYTYESGYGPFFNDFEISKAFHEELRELGLNMRKMTAKFLSRVSEIREFYVNFEDEDMKEQDNGNGGIWIELRKMSFTDRRSAKCHHVPFSVLEKYNRSVRPSEAA